MKRNSVRNLVLSAALCLTALAAGSTTAHAQANVTFSGGSGSPLAFTLQNTVTYTVTTASANTQLLFVLKGVPISGALPFTPVSGSLSYTINNGAPLTFVREQEGAYTGGNINANDFYAVTTDADTVAVGDTITVFLGNLTTSSNVTVAPPTSGSYTTLIDAAAGTAFAVSGQGAAAAPEPGTWAMLALGGVLAVGIRMRKVRSA